MIPVDRFNAMKDVVLRCKLDRSPEAPQHPGRGWKPTQGITATCSYLVDEYPNENSELPSFGAEWQWTASVGVPTSSKELQYTGSWEFLHLAPGLWGSPVPTPPCRPTHGAGLQNPDWRLRSISCSFATEETRFDVVPFFHDTSTTSSVVFRKILGTETEPGASFDCSLKLTPGGTFMMFLSATCGKSVTQTYLTPLHLRSVSVLNLDPSLVGRQQLRALDRYWRRTIAPIADAHRRDETSPGNRSRHLLIISDSTHWNRQSRTAQQSGLHHSHSGLPVSYTYQHCTPGVGSVLVLDGTFAFRASKALMEHCSPHSQAQAVNAVRPSMCPHQAILHVALVGSCLLQHSLRHQGVKKEEEVEANARILVHSALQDDFCGVGYHTTNRCPSLDWLDFLHWTRRRRAHELQLSSTSSPSAAAGMALQLESVSTNLTRIRLNATPDCGRRAAHQPSSQPSSLTLVGFQFTLLPSQDVQGYMLCNSALRLVHEIRDDSSPTPRFLDILHPTSLSSIASNPSFRQADPPSGILLVSFGEAQPLEPAAKEGSSETWKRLIAFDFIHSEIQRVVGEPTKIPMHSSVSINKSQLYRMFLRLLSGEAQFHFATSSIGEDSAELLSETSASLALLRNLASQDYCKFDDQDSCYAAGLRQRFMRQLAKGLLQSLLNEVPVAAGAQDRNLTENRGGERFQEEEGETISLFFEEPIPAEGDSKPSASHGEGNEPKFWLEVLEHLSSHRSCSGTHFQSPEIFLAQSLRRRHTPQCALTIEASLTQLLLDKAAKALASKGIHVDKSFGTASVSEPGSGEPREQQEVKMLAKNILEAVKASVNAPTDSRPNGGILHRGIEAQRPFRFSLKRVRTPTPSINDGKSVPPLPTRKPRSVEDALSVWSSWIRKRPREDDGVFNIGVQLS